MQFKKNQNVQFIAWGHFPELLQNELNLLFRYKTFLLIEFSPEVYWKHRSNWTGIFPP